MIQEAVPLLKSHFIKGTEPADDDVCDVHIVASMQRFN